MHKGLGNGNDIFLFYDKWINRNTTLISQLDTLQMPVHIKNRRVSEIIENGKWVLKDKFLLPVWNIIQSQEIEKTDTLIHGNEMPTAQDVSVLQLLGIWAEFLNLLINLLILFGFNHTALRCQYAF